jgi:hypothetical protein
MGSTLSGVPLYSRNGYRRQKEFTVPVGAGEGITVVRMVKEV